MQEILGQLSLGICPMQRCTASDFHVRVSALLDTDEVSKIHEGLSSLKLCGWLKSDTLTYFSQKMSRDFSTTITDEPSEQSSEQWMNWGTMSNGRCVIANTLGFPKIEKESSLLDIIEGGGSTYKILPLDTDYTEIDELQGYELVSNTIAAGKRDSVGCYILTESDQRERERERE